MHDDRSTGRDGGTMGCIVIVAALILLGSALGVAGFLFGDWSPTSGGRTAMERSEPRST